jgi:hypothetical protein
MFGTFSSFHGRSSAFHKRLRQRLFHQTLLRRASLSYLTGSLRKCSSLLAQVPLLELALLTLDAFLVLELLLPQP